MGLWTLWVTGTLSIKSTGQHHGADRVFTHRFLGRAKKIYGNSVETESDIVFQDRFLPCIADGRVRRAKVRSVRNPDIGAEVG